MKFMFLAQKYLGLVITHEKQTSGLVVKKPSFETFL